MRDGCYICQPDNPAAAPEGCQSCEAEFWEYANALARSLGVQR